MKVSLNTIKQFTDVEVTVDQLVDKINRQLGQVEEVVDLGAKYKDVVVVKVVECDKHPNADKLSVCKIDDGGVVVGVPRDEEGLVQVVCGAPNARAGIFAAWLPPTSTVPATFSDKEPLVLDARELRGILSQGMLAAPDELAIGSGHDGIVEITESDLPKSKIQNLKSGESFSKLFDLNDTIIDIENKMFTHRPDCFGQLGVAREISAILKGLPADSSDVDTQFVNPDWYWEKPTFASGEGLDLTVFNNAPDKAPRFMAVAMKNIDVKPSPLWLQIELSRLGSKAINNVVDVTNYMMLLTAQPSHAYDYEKLRGGELGVRMAKQGEKATFLNGKSYELAGDDVVIADREGVIGLAGIIGGGDSEVSAETKNIVIEVASFDMYSLRKSSMRHGIFTDALTRFSKGQSYLQNDRILARIMQLMSEYAGATQATEVFDEPDTSGQLDEVSIHGEISVSTDFVNARLGSALEQWQIGGLLRRANFASYPAENDPDTLLVTAPFWRTDIQLPEDVVEEVGRLYGFDKLPRELPRRSITPPPKNQSIEIKQRIRQVMARAGANEVLTYSFVHENTLKKAGQDPAKAFKLSNALSPDLQYYRLSLLPSLLDKVHMNVKTGYDAFALFEIGKAHVKEMLDDEGLPREFNRIVCVVTARKRTGAAYYDAKRLLEVILDECSIGDLRFEPLSTKETDLAATCYIPGRSATITSGGVVLGYVGEFRADVQKSFKLPDFSAGFELDIDVLQTLQQDKAYVPLSRFPSVTQDISLRVADDLPYAQLYDMVQQTLAGRLSTMLTARVVGIGVYRPAGEVTKNISFRVTVTSYERTLTDQDVNALLDAVTTATEKAYGAQRI